MEIKLLRCYERPFNFYFGNYCFSDEFVVIKGFNKGVIIGIAKLEK